MSFELNKKLAAKRAPLQTSAKVDPVTAGIIRGAFETVCFEAATHLGRAASSPIINQSNERNGSVLDAHGRLAAVSIGTPHLVFISQLTVRYGLEHFEDYDWGPGDVFLGNDPDYGGGHLPDYNVYAPVFDDKGELILIQALQAHQGDTGGKDPGGFTLEATDIFTEGSGDSLPQAGPPRREAPRRHQAAGAQQPLPELRRRSRGHDRRRAALREAARGRDYASGAPMSSRRPINYNIDHTEKRFREEIAKWPDGNYEADVFIDHDTLGTKDVKVHVACMVQGDQLTVDLTGTDDRPELVGVWNTFANSRGYVMTQIASAIDPTIVKNEGLFNAVEIIIPENTIAHPPLNKPAALGSFHPAVRDHRGGLRGAVAGGAGALRAAGLQDRHAQCGDRLQERTDVDGSGCRCAHHGCIRGAGHRWLGLVSGGAGQSAAVGSRGCGEPFSDHQHQPRNDHRLRRRGPLARPARQSQREEGSGADHGDGLDGVGGASAARHVRRRRCQLLIPTISKSARPTNTRSR